MTTNASYPPISFQQCIHLAWASYSRSMAACKAYFRGSQSRFEVLDHATVSAHPLLERVGGTWSLVFCKSNDSGGLWIGIEGSSSYVNLLESVIYHMTGAETLVERMAEQINTLAQRHGLAVQGLCGHSAAGLFQQRLSQLFPDAWSVSFNGHRVGTGQRHVNLRSHWDPIALIFASTRHSIPLRQASSGHALSNFLPAANLDWSAIYNPSQLLTQPSGCPMLRCFQSIKWGAAVCYGSVSHPMGAMFNQASSYASELMQGLAELIDVSYQALSSKN